MVVDFQYAYLVLIIPFAVIWALIFILSQKTRKAQLIMSFLFLPAGTIGEILYFQDYWNPASVFSFNIGNTRFLIEDFLFSFFIAGIGGAVYGIISRRGLIKLEEPVNKFLSFFPIFIVGALISYFLFSFGVNSIFSTSIAFIIVALFMLRRRKNLVLNSILSGLAVMLIMLIAYFILYNAVENSEALLRQGWFLYGTFWGFSIFGIPITEMLWGFSAGMLLGSLYEFLRDLKEK